MNISALSLFPTVTGVGLYVAEALKCRVPLGDESLIYLLEEKARAKKLRRAAERVVFRYSPEIRIDQRQALEEIVLPYRTYLAKVGHRPEAAQVEVFLQVVNSEAINKLNAFYNPKTRRVEIPSKLIEMPDVVRRAFTHYALSSAHNIQKLRQPVAAIDLGLADYFPCSFQNDPKIGRRYVELFGRDLGEEFVKRGALRDLTGRSTLTLWSIGTMLSRARLGRRSLGDRVHPRSREERQTAVYELDGTAG